MAQCGTCKGLGYVTCPQCNGTGSVINSEGKQIPCNATRICDDCGGSGEKA